MLAATDMTRNDWIQTYTGRAYFPAAPRAEDVDIRDIAHALSMLCRYTGHVTRFYSVAEHSIHVSNLVPPEDALAGLLHDGTEAYCNDLASPFKRHLPDYKAAEARNWLAIAEHFSLSPDLPQSVHDADYAMLFAEKAQLFQHPPPMDWAIQPRGAVPDVGTLGMVPMVAEYAFLRRYRELTHGRYIKLA